MSATTAKTLAAAAAALAPPALAAAYVARGASRLLRVPPGAALDRPSDYGLAPEPFEAIAADGVKVSGWAFAPPAEPGEGVVILCHGRGLNKTRLLYHVKLIVDAGMTAVAFDFRGCGDTPNPERPWFEPLGRGSLDLEAVVRHVERRHARPSRPPPPLGLMGFSYGGNMAIAHAGFWPTPYRAIVLDSTPLTHYESILGLQLARERRGRRLEPLRERLDRVTTALVARLVRSAELYDRACESAARLGATPLLSIVGEKDTYYDLDEACAFLERHYAGPKRVWRVARGRHLTNHLASPSAYAQAVPAFFRDAFRDESPARGAGRGAPTAGRRANDGGVRA